MARSERIRVKSTAPIPSGRAKAPRRDMMGDAARFATANRTDAERSRAAAEGAARARPAASTSAHTQQSGRKDVSQHLNSAFRHSVGLGGCAALAEQRWRRPRQDCQGVRSLADTERECALAGARCQGRGARRGTAYDMHAEPWRGARGAVRD